MGKVKCTFISVWDGGVEIDSPALFDEKTGRVSEIQIVPMPTSMMNSLEVLDKEVVRVNGKEYELERNDDDTYSAIRPYEVFFCRAGYAVVSATSEKEALRIADQELKYDDVSWDDDWHPTDVQLEE